MPVNWLWQMFLYPHAVFPGHNHRGPLDWPGKRVIKKINEGTVGKYNQVERGNAVQTENCNPELVTCVFT